MLRGVVSKNYIGVPPLGRFAVGSLCSGVRFFSGTRFQYNAKNHESEVMTFSDITGEGAERELANVLGPIGGDTGGNGLGSNNTDGKNDIKPNEKTVKYVLNCLFGKNNSHFTYSAVVEDINYMKINGDKASYNEAYLYYLKLPQRVKFSVSTGCLGFRKAARGEYEATFQTAAKVFQMIREKRLLDKNIEIVMKDFGKGRAAFIAALNGKEGTVIRKNVARIGDNTPLKFGGVRSPRVRRL